MDHLSVTKCCRGNALTYTRFTLMVVFFSLTILHENVERNVNLFNLVELFFSAARK